MVIPDDVMASKIKENKADTSQSSTIINLGDDDQVQDQNHPLDVAKP